MWNEPTKLQLSLIPKFYSTENIPSDKKKVYMKFFIGNMTFYVIEYDGKDQFFGYVHNASAPDMSELGYFSLSELKSIKQGFVEVDREIHGIQPRTPKLFSEVKKDIERGIY